MHPNHHQFAELDAHNSVWKRSQGRTSEHRQTKRAATDMFGLPPLRHTPTLPDLVIRRGDIYWRETPFETLELVRRKTAFTAGGHSLGGPSTEPGTIRSWR